MHNNKVVNVTFLIWHMQIIHKYFPTLSNEQTKQFEMLQTLYNDWNEKINVISRKDINNLYEHHVLHSLSIAKLIHFKNETRVLDFGSGGGFPGIPLAIMFPKVKFTLIDGTRKKVYVAQKVAQAIELKNVVAKHLRGEEERGKYDFIVSRAVMPLPNLVKIIKKNIAKSQKNALPNGVICLKGGNLDNELKPFSHIVECTKISTILEEEWFKEKNIVYLPL